MGKKLQIGIVLAIVVVIAIYALIPSALATNPHHLKNDQNYYVYGKVYSEFSINGHSVFLLNDSGTVLLVNYNGTLPPMNSTVLVSGEYVNTTFFGFTYGGVLMAKAVYNWYF